MSNKLDGRKMGLGELAGLYPFTAALDLIGSCICSKVFEHNPNSNFIMNDKGKKNEGI